ncbi:MAG: HAMP domain-containing sensor histidine kinase [Ignavibacteriales bacterium]|nr:HAMP domain-containing sensor histidine kinase [Ignavibacteriales bacterium]
MFTTFSINISLPFYTVEDLRTRIGWYVNLRWIAVFGVLASVPISQGMFHFKIAYTEMLFVASILVVLNLIYFFLWKHLPQKNAILELAFAEVQIFLDLILISFLIHYSGGVDNPFFFLYLVHVILSGILFPGTVLPYINATFAALLFTIWSILEYFNVVAQYTLLSVSVPLSMLIVSLSAFYIINFSGIYIINNFMLRYRSLKKIIDEKNDLLEKSIEQRSKTFRFAAHEIKAPLTAIKSTLEVVKDLYKNDLKPEVFDLVQRAERRSDQVLGMVKEMIMITQYNLLTEKPVLEKVNMEEWMWQLVIQQQSSALAKGIKLFVISSGKLKEVEIDKVGMEKVLDNLLSNAIRYTPCGGAVNVEPFMKKHSFGFSISDTGIGIEEKDLEHIFDEFYRTKEAKQMEQIGTGLGLNLVKEIIKKNDGTISVTSIVGKGSTFKIELPLFSNEEEEEPEYKDVHKHYLFE